MVEGDVEAGLERGIREFNGEDFFACHDTLEEVWMGVRGEERRFFQGLIQVATGYYHLTGENYPGAEHLLERGIAKLLGFLPVHRGIDLADLVVRASQTLAEVLEVRAGKRAAYDPETIPKIGRMTSI